MASFRNFIFIYLHNAFHIHNEFHYFRNLEFFYFSFFVWDFLFALFLFVEKSHPKIEIQNNKKNLNFINKKLKF